jgi:hypothetical protein
MQCGKDVGVFAIVLILRSHQA